MELPSSPTIRQSSTVQSFSADLDSIFATNKPLTELSAKVEEKKREVTSQTAELAALEDQLKATKARLARVTGTSPPSGQTSLSSRPNVVAGDRASAGTGAQQVGQGGEQAGTHTSTSLPLRTENSVSAQVAQPGMASTGTEVPGSGSSGRKSLQAPRMDSLGLPPVPGAMPVTPGIEEAAQEMQ